MPGSRTIKTLAILLIAMTVGAVALMVMEVSPSLPTRNLAAMAEGSAAGKVVQQTDVPIQASKWRHVVVHSSAEGRDIARKCHFLVLPEPGGDGVVFVATELWKGQLAGEHAYGRYDYNRDSIGVCLMGDFSRKAPSNEQYTALVALVQYLQAFFEIEPARVYLYRDLVGGDWPGKAFPTSDFSSRLLNPGR
jgi:N-acetylmuramoyl-L-alanine amidase